MIDFAKLISNLAVSFINISIDQIDEGINEALKRIGEYAKADRCYVFLFSENREKINKVNEWTTKGVAPLIDQLQDIPVDLFPWSSEKILQGKMIIVPRVKDLPEEAKAEKEEWLGLNIQSLINFPIYKNKKVCGFIGFDAVQQETIWQEDTVALLQISGDMIGNVLARRATEEAHRTKVEELSVLHSLSLAMTVANTIDELVLSALLILGETLYNDNAGISLVNKKNNVFNSVYRNNRGEVIKENYPLDAGISGIVFKTGEITVVDDVSTYPEFVSIYPDIKSELIVPLKVGTEVIGLINIESCQLAAFGKKELDWVDIFARQLSIAIEKQRLFLKVQELAIRDSLTGLYNRRHFFELAETEFSRSRRYGTPLSLIMLDIDGFKQVNDLYGHGLGDQMLIALGDVFNKGLRATDVPGRYGGDEFVVLLPGSDTKAAKLVAERLNHFTNQLTVSGTRGTVSITICQGIATLDEDCPSLEILLDYADQALLAAKKKRPSQVCVWGEIIS